MNLIRITVPSETPADQVDRLIQSIDALDSGFSHESVLEDSLFTIDVHPYCGVDIETLMRAVDILVLRLGLSDVQIAQAAPDMRYEISAEPPCSPEQIARLESNVGTTLDRDGAELACTVSWPTRREDMAALSAATPSQRWTVLIDEQHGPLIEYYTGGTLVEAGPVRWRYPTPPWRTQAMDALPRTLVESDTTLDSAMTDAFAAITGTCIEPGRVFAVIHRHDWSLIHEHMCQWSARFPDRLLTVQRVLPDFPRSFRYFYRAGRKIGGDHVGITWPAAPALSFHQDDLDPPLAERLRQAHAVFDWCDGQADGAPIDMLPQDAVRRCVASDMEILEQPKLYGCGVTSTWQRQRISIEALYRLCFVFQPERVDFRDMYKSRLFWIVSVDHKFWVEVATWKYEIQLRFFVADPDDRADLAVHRAQSLPVDGSDPRRAVLEQQRYETAGTICTHPDGQEFFRLVERVMTRRWEVYPGNGFSV